MSSLRRDHRFNGVRGRLFNGGDETDSLHYDIARINVRSSVGMWDTAQSVAVWSCWSRAD
jgi:hypothetical protein